MASDKNTIKFIGKYEIIEEIGKGGMGVVYKGIDPYIERTLAIKTIRFDIPKDEADHKKWKKRFLREAKLAGNLTHPNIVTIYDAGEESGLFYIAMEYIEGKNLREMIQSSKKISFEDVQSLMEQICDALSYASKKGVIHCDIKPENIILDTEGKVYLVDFGIARTSSTDLTKTMLSMVTPSYTSPERLNGQEPDIRSDIFALGAVLYEIISGQKAFQGDTVSTIMKSILYDAPTKAKTISSDIPKEIHYIINRALAKEPEDRYQTYDEFSNDLRKKKFNVSKPIAITLLAAIVFAGLYLFYMSKEPLKESGGYAANGKKYIEDKNYNKAIDNLKKVLGSDPNDFNAYYLLGLAYQKKGNFDESITHYKKAIDINKSFAPSYKGLAEAYEEKGELEQAVSYNEKYIQLFPNEENAEQIREKLTALKINTDSDAEEVKKTEPVETAESVSKVNAENGQKDITKNVYEKGKKHFEDQQYEQAIVFFQEALKVEPENEDVQRYLKLASHEKEKREDIDLNRSLGVKAYENKNYLQAAIYFDEILNMDPENQDAKKYLALIRQGVIEAKIEEITQPAVIQERPFFKRTVKVLALDPGQAVKFEKVYSITGGKLEQQLQGSTDEKQRSQVLQTFSRQTYSELRKILRADQLVKLDNLIAARKERKNQFLGSNEIQKESEATATAAPDNGTDEEKVVGKTNEQDAIKNDPSDSEESTATTDETVETPEGKENINESLSFGIQAYNEKNYNQAVFYFNEVLKTEPNNEEAKKYLEYIELAKMRMVNDKTTG
ncbi:MAG: protein kinase, partial [Deltaproteobacteria bacterium]|nr:protein kinase [Deltaproteobacteria bacterium]